MADSLKLSALARYELRGHACRERPAAQRGAIAILQRWRSSAASENVSRLLLFGVSEPLSKRRQRRPMSKNPALSDHPLRGHLAVVPMLTLQLL